MPDITRRPWAHHLRAAATEHVVQLRRGRTVRSAAGATFWFRPRACTLSQVPVDDRELPLLFHTRTADFQDVTVQATVSFRFEDPDTAARRIDFSIDPVTGRWRGAPTDQIAQLLTELAQQHALDLVAQASLAALLAGGEDGGIARIRARVTEGLAGDPRLGEVGLRVVGVRVVAVRPEPDVERALQTPARERLQAEADRATYERRATAVERERTISENELQSRIELATREEQLVLRQGANERRRAEEKAAADAVGARAGADATRVQAEAQAEATRLLGLAKADAEAAHLAAYAQAEPGVMLALAVRELARGLPKVGSLTITPDLIGPALQQLAGTAR